VLYILIWIAGGLLLFSIGNIFIRIEVYQLPFFIGSFTLVGLLSRLLLFLPTNLGFTEISLSVLISTVLPSSFAVVIAIANRIITMCYELIWALLSLLIEKLSSKNN
jgi:hypothetical protein